MQMDQSPWRSEPIIIETGHVTFACDTTASSIHGMERDVLTMDGLSIHIRAARPEDGPELVRFHAEELSEASSSSRFLGAVRQLADRQVSEWASADGRRNATLLAEHDGLVVAVGLYRGLDQHRADVAFAVADRLQHRGIATILLEDLAVVARRAGYTHLVAETRPSNTAMHAVFRDFGLAYDITLHDGIHDVVMPLGDGHNLEAWARKRDRLATAASMRPILEPRHVVVFGASESRQRPGNAALRNLRRAFNGQVSVVHPTATQIDGVVAFSTVGSIAEPIDLAVIAVPAAAVPQVIEDCGKAGIRAAVVLSAGFSETGRDGTVLQADMLERARRHGMRLVGPNCFGVANPAMGLDTTFGANEMNAGSIALASQSGGLGIALLAEVGRRGLGISGFVSLGNKADVSGNDLLCYWAEDPATNVIALYLESFGNPRRFASLARSISPHRPIVALKGGRTEAGQRGARSHTAALMTNDTVVDALFTHGGVVRVRTLEELIDVTSLFDSQPIPNGDRVAIIGNAGGPLILAADAAEASSLVVPVLSDDLQQQLRHAVPDAAATANPVDLLATVNGDQLRTVLGMLADSGEVDAIVVVTVPVSNVAEPLGTAAQSTAHQLPIIVAEMGERPDRTAAGSFPAPERAIHALSRVVSYASWCRNIRTETSEPISPTSLAIDAEAVRAYIRGLDPADLEWLNPADAFVILTQIGVPIAPCRYVHTAAELADALAAVGFPVVLKADAVGVLHKTEEHAVVRGLMTPDQAALVFDQFHADFTDRLRGVIVQHEMPSGLELIVGARRSERYGPLLLVGAGGTAAEILGDRTTVLAPATPAEIVAAFQQLRIAPLLAGYRDHPAVGVTQLTDLVYRVGRLISEVPEIVEMDLNPVIASASVIAAVDVRMRVRMVENEAVPMRGLRDGQRASTPIAAATEPT
jgi:acetate---CoA ligase (ADP-forming)